VTPEVSVITNVGFDHEAYLGSELASIAAEKAGIIKAGVPVVSGAVGVAADVIAARAAALATPLEILDRDFTLTADAHGRLGYRSERRRRSRRSRWRSRVSTSAPTPHSRFARSSSCPISRRRRRRSRRARRGTVARPPPGSVPANRLCYWMAPTTRPGSPRFSRSSASARPVVACGFSSA
jgi:hypothetical protein